MTDNVKMPLGLVLIIAAHMVFNVSSRAQVTGILGTNITLQFRFNVSITKHSQLNVNNNIGPTGQRKIDDYVPEKGKKGHRFQIHPENKTVCWHLTNLKLNDTGRYWATVITEVTTDSDVVELSVREENRSSTVPPTPSDIPGTKGNGSITSHIVTVLVVSPVVLLAAVLPLLIWCLVRTKDKEEPPSLPPGRNSNSTVQETFEDSKNVPASSLVYSVLDFPKRPSAVLELNLSDTEYAAVSYLTENRRV